MSDAPLSTAPADRPGARAFYVIGGLSFATGVAVTFGAYQLGVSPLQRPAPRPTPALAAPATPPPAGSAAMPASDLATLGAREQALAARLDALDLRLHDIEGSARTAATQASRAEQLLIALSVRRALDRGVPLGPLAAQLRQRFGEREPAAVAAILNAAADPVSIEDLRLALSTLEPRLMSGPDDGMFTHARRLLTDLVVLREADSPSPRPADRLARAERALEAGQVEAALAEVMHLPGAAYAGSWAAAARRYIAARHALTTIEAAAIAALPLPARGAPPVAAPAPAGAPANP